MPVRAITGAVSKTARGRIGNTTKVRGTSTPAPTKGWNARDSIANMEADEAFTLDNVFPEETYVRLRRGYASHATGLGAAVETLMSWNGPASSKLFGAADDEIFEVTSSGAVGSADVGSLTNGRWQHTMFGVSSGKFLVAANGEDAVRNYDGTTWTTPTLTGVTSADLIHVFAFKGRLFFVEKDTLSAWYLALESISGTITEFDLGPQATLGGYLVAGGRWTLDAGDGVDDLAVFVTSEGQAIVFAGTDPASTDTWAHVGTYRIGRPLGRRPLIQLGGDLVIMTEDGFSQLSRFIRAGRASQKAAMSDKIQGAITDAIQSITGHHTAFGWQPIHYPNGNMVAFNIPYGTGSRQYVSNATTGAWCRYLGIDAECWEIHDDMLFFGHADGSVYQAETGFNDANLEIKAHIDTAFSYFGSRGHEKRIAMVRPNLESTGIFDLGLRVNTDFAHRHATSLQSAGVDTGSLWDVGLWDVANWGGGTTPWNRWKGAEGIGQAASLSMDIHALDIEVKLNSIDWKVEPARSAGYI